MSDFSSASSSESKGAWATRRKNLEEGQGGKDGVERRRKKEKEEEEERGVMVSAQNYEDYLSNNQLEHISVSLSH